MPKRLCLTVALFAWPSLADLPRPGPAEPKPADSAERPAELYLVSNVDGSPLRGLAAVTW